MDRLYWHMIIALSVIAVAAAFVAYAAAVAVLFGWIDHVETMAGCVK